MQSKYLGRRRCHEPDDDITHILHIGLHTRWNCVRHSHPMVAGVVFQFRTSTNKLTSDSLGLLLPLLVPFAALPSVAKRFEEELSCDLLSCRCRVFFSSAACFCCSRLWFSCSRRCA